ncbi:MAG: hypothetical protein GY761_06545, partial [Hyphomicrobiales bacterium]|nr:hypothetical protein [Hyphomicrobiales bacterium]
MAGGTKISSLASFENWIDEHKPPVEWLRALSCRMALRMMPFAMVVGEGSGADLLNKMTVEVYRANLVLRIANAWPKREIPPSIFLDAAENTGKLSGDVFPLNNAAGDAAKAVAAASRVVIESDLGSVEQQVKNVALAVNDAIPRGSNESIWQMLQSDNDWLMKNPDNLAATDELTRNEALQAGLMRRPLWGSYKGGKLKPG